MPSRTMEPQVTSHRPDWFDRTPWAKEIGLVVLGIAIGLPIGSGWINTTKIDQVQQSAGQAIVATQAHANRTIQAIEAKIPKGAPSKSEKPSTQPDCITVHPPAE